MSYKLSVQVPDISLDKRKTAGFL